MAKAKVRPRASVGIALFFVSAITLILVAAPMQRTWGMWGFVLTEFMLLALAVIPARVFRWEFKEVFPMRIPSLDQIFGVLVLWLGSYIAVYASTMFLYYWFPGGMGEVSTALSEFFSGMPMPLTVLMVAGLPSVGEEFLHRGLIQYTFRGKPRWMTIVSMGVIFGLFHLDPYRFVGTAILGAVLTYIMVETKNLLLPIFMHFANNAVSTFLGLLSESSLGPTDLSVAAVGSALILSAIVPFLLLLGSRMLLRGEPRKVEPIGKGTWALTVFLALLLVMAGTAILDIFS
ncbi:MAG TPA: hypothetical protein DDW87_01010 [Firmicutes bacterium]|nr:hypothetical protein [Bacillota bacterium]